MENSTFGSQTATEVTYPSLSDRVQSTFMDGIFIIIMMFLAGTIMDRYENVPDWIRIIVFVGLWAVYEPLCTTLGGTIGNHFKSIRVRNIYNVKRRINIGQAFLRYVIKCLLGWLSFLTMHSNQEKRAMHDFAAGSVMIKVG
jgi:hypothetical protein